MEAARQTPTKVEWLLGAVALAVVAGWVLQWSSTELSLFRSWFSAFSFLGSIVLVAWLALRLFGVLRVPPQVARRVVPLVSLVPVLGFLIEIVTPPHQLLTIGGSVLLAYISGTAFWRKELLALAGKEIVPTAEGTLPPVPAPESSTPPSHPAGS